jgi:LacI family transcriptional regulator
MGDGMGNGSHNRGRRVTLADVARAAGLSPTTVSLALNRPREQCHLSEATQQRAIEAATRLGYRPNWRARALAKKQTFTIGLMYDGAESFCTPANEPIVVSVARTLRAGGYHALLVPLGADSDDWQDVIRSDRLDGCLAIFPTSPRFDQVYAEAGMPMVMINLMSDRPVPQVLADDRGGMRQAMAHLLELGHQDIAFVARSSNNHYSCHLRQEEYERVMIEAGLRERARIIPGDALCELMCLPLTSKDWPTALVCYDHNLAMQVLSGCCDQRIPVPEHVSVVGFNDIAMTAWTAPPLTMVRVPGEEIGQRGARLLIDLIENRKQESGAVAESAASPPREWFTEELIVRQSTGRPRR